MKRRLRTVLDLLHPDLVEDRKRRNEELRDKHLSKGQLRSFSPNDAVYIKNHSSGQTWIPGTVIEKTGALSYKTVTPDGKSFRCHIDQMINRKTSLVSSQSSPETQENSTSPFCPFSDTVQLKLLLQLKSKLLRRPLLNPIKTDLDEPYFAHPILRTTLCRGGGRSVVIYFSSIFKL
ncbi:hypothetical protein AVEN_215605-1 [Araneus ventricosus]|uniref:DUF5641 domain-containing protein n=1 Tax=Araneus ventricosus TaxID=182803 RepID=A0A4Y2S7Z1_ARAVE|nr:hypothetical protein AVEN_215605-1 [Araneus ventricosus]